MELNPDELAMLDEISIQPPTKKVVTFKPKPHLMTRAPQEEPAMDAFVNPSKLNPNMMQQQQFESNDDDPEQEEDYGQYQQEAPAAPAEGYKTIEDEKGDLLNKLARLQKRGFLIGKKFGPHNDIEELRTEYKRTMYTIECDQSVKFQRRILIAAATGLEFLNKRYDPFDIYLDGWSENMMENADDYDPIFEELYAKYRDKVAVAPEIKLIMMVGGSAMMFHLTHSMFKAAIPNMADVMKQNPELVKSMVDAVKTTGPREMRGPGIDIGNLLGPFGGMIPKPPPPAPPQSADDDISDIVSVMSEGGTKDVKISGEKKKKRSKKEVTL
jgi:hypothetical protein